MLYLIAWWFIIEILGLIALPLTLAFLRNLPGRGYPFAQPLGLLLGGYLFWMSVSLGFLRNSRAGIIFSLFIVALASLFFLGLKPQAWRERGEFVCFFRRERALLLGTEFIFTLAFLAYAFFRAHDPSIDHTEQPMDFGFINAILRSLTFPPRDQWLSGYAISYYYFGYLLVALLTKLSGIPSGIAYNLALALIFAWTVRCAFGLVYALVRGAEGQEKAALGFGVLGSLLVAFVGNLEGALEFLHAQGWGTEAFWRWVGIENLAEAPLSRSWNPGFDWWWWRATRIIYDENSIGKLPEVISEFPAFSFMLGDLHPHVMALPFGLLALAIALNLLSEGRETIQPSTSILQMLCLGALGFLNTWDFPVYSLLVIAACAFSGYRRGLGGVELLKYVVSFALRLLLGGFALYIIFYVSFRSQAGGFEALFYAKTKLHHYLLFFGLFLCAVLGFLVSLSGAWRGLWRAWLTIFFSLLAGALAVTFVFALPRGVLLPALYIALARPWTFFLIALLLSWAGALLWQKIQEGAETGPTFALLLICLGLALTYATEFIYLRDSFATRMNTIFKFYYQSWVFLGVASAFGAHWIASKGRGFWRWACLGAFGFLVVVGLYYPAAAFYSKAGGFNREPTLDGTAYLQKSRPAEFAAIRWLAENAEEDAIIVEATGCQYCERSRVSAWTGIPTILGWPGHERQWRGNNLEAGRREPEVQTIYQSLDVKEVKSLLKKYGVRYVYLSDVERGAYHLSSAQVDKFGLFMDLVYDEGGVKIYKWDADEH